MQLKQAKTDPTAEAAAAATFDRILRSDHEWSPNADLYPPATRNFVAKLRAKAQKKSTRVALTVSTKPAGLPVFADAKPLGTSPQTILLPAGGTYSVEADWGEGKRGLTRMVALEEAPAVIELDRACSGRLAPRGLRPANGRNRHRRARRRRRRHCDLLWSSNGRGQSPPGRRLPGRSLHRHRLVFD